MHKDERKRININWTALIMRKVYFYDTDLIFYRLKPVLWSYQFLLHVSRQEFANLWQLWSELVPYSLAGCSKATLVIWSERLAKSPYQKNTPPAVKPEPAIHRLQIRAFINWAILDPLVILQVPLYIIKSSQDHAFSVVALLHTESAGALASSGQVD